MAPQNRDNAPAGKRELLDRLLDKLAAGAIVGLTITSTAEAGLLNAGLGGVSAWSVDPTLLTFDVDQDGFDDVEFGWSGGSPDDLAAFIQTAQSQSIPGADSIFLPDGNFIPPALDLDLGQVIPDSIAFQRSVSLGGGGTSTPLLFDGAALAYSIDATDPVVGIGDGPFFEVDDARFASFLFSSFEQTEGEFVVRMGWADVNINIVDGVPQLIVNDLYYQTDRLSTLEDGDFNLDGLVDAADYTLWRDGALDCGPEFGCSGFPADGNQDGFVDELDYGLWSAGYGDAFFPIASGAGTAVPEPSTAAFSLLAAGSAAVGRRREALQAARGR